MKVRTFRKCIHRKKNYKYYPYYTNLIIGIGLGEDTKYKCGKMKAWRENGKWKFNLLNE